MWTVLLAAVLLAPQGGGRGGAVGSAAGVGVRPVLELTLAAPVELPDGRRLGAATLVTPGSAPWFVYSTGSLCDSAISRGTAPIAAAEAWRVSVTERSRTNTQIMVTVAWTRIWERGRAVQAGSSGTSELTLQIGDRVPLDRITRPSSAECAATQKSIELRVSGRLPQPPPAADAVLPAPVSAELWMVHVVPGKGELVERQVVRLGPGGVGFLFRGQPVESAVGPIVLELNGQLRAVQRPDGTTGLWTGLTRSVTSHVTGRTYSTTGTGEKIVDWLSAGDVVSFDLPDPVAYATPAAGGGGGRGGVASAGGGVGATRGGGAGGASARGPNLLEGHRLSLRVRLIGAD